MGASIVKAEQELMELTTIQPDIKMVVISFWKTLFCPFLAGKANPSAGDT